MKYSNPKFVYANQDRDNKSWQYYRKQEGLPEWINVNTPLVRVEHIVSIKSSFMRKEKKSFLIFSDRTQNYYSIERTKDYIGIQYSTRFSSLRERFGTENRQETVHQYDGDIVRNYTFGMLLTFANNERQSEFHIKNNNSHDFVRNILGSCTVETRKQLQHQGAILVKNISDEPLPYKYDNYRKHFDLQKCIVRVEVYREVINGMIGTSEKWVVILKEEHPFYFLLKKIKEGILIHIEQKIRRLKEAYLSPANLCNRIMESDVETACTIEDLFDFLDVERNRKFHVEDSDVHFAKRIYAYLRSKPL